MVIIGRRYIISDFNLDLFPYNIEYEYLEFLKKFLITVALLHNIILNFENKF